MLLIAVLCGGLSGVAASSGTAGAAASNGEAAKSPTEILADAAAAIGSTNGVLISGTVQGDNGRVTINLVSGQGAGGGVMFINGARIDLVLAPPNVYMKGSERAWASITGNDAAATLLAGKWIQGTTADENLAGLASLADISKMSESLLKPDGTVTKGPVTVYQGKKAIPLHDDGANPSTLYIAATGPPYPLGVVKDDTAAGAVRFSKYGKVHPPTPPAHAVNLDQLEAGAS